MLIALFVLVALGVVAVAIAAFRIERRRVDAMAREAARLGLRFSPGRDRNLADQYRELRGLDEGSNRYAFDILRGNHHGHPVTAFDFHYETYSPDSNGGRRTSHHLRHVVLLHLERDFPSLLIAPEGILSKIAQAAGYDDIDFESHEFSRRFCVRSPDRKFAYDFCHPLMIESLLGQPALRLEVRARVLAFVREKHLVARDFASELDLACAIRERMPAYLFAA